MTVYCRIVGAEVRAMTLSRSKAEDWGEGVWAMPKDWRYRIIQAMRSGAAFTIGEGLANIAREHGTQLESGQGAEA
jgi:hypothetical protein